MATTAQRMALLVSLDKREPELINALVEHAKTQIISAELVKLELDTIADEMKKFPALQ